MSGGEEISPCCLFIEFLCFSVMSLIRFVPMSCDLIIPTFLYKRYGSTDVEVLGFYTA